MTKPFIEVFGSALCFLVVLGMDSAMASSVWYEKGLEKVIASHQCQLIEQNHPTIPFHHILTGKIYVTWCRGSTSYNLIVLTQSSSHDWAKCSRYIRLTTAKPKILWIENPVTLETSPASLDQFWYLGDDGYTIGQRGPSGINTTGPGLWFGIQGDLANVVYCHEGKWLLAGIH